MQNIKFYAEFPTNLRWKSGENYKEEFRYLNALSSNDVKFTMCINIANSSISFLSNRKLAKKEIAGIIDQEMFDGCKNPSQYKWITTIHSS